jgi:hypothetical protein
MRRTVTLVMAFVMMLGMFIIPASASSETDQQCPGAVDENSQNYVPVPDGYEIVLDNDTTETYPQSERNDTILPEGTLVCIKGGPSSTGIVAADGTSTLKQLLGQYVTVGQGNVPDVSYYMTYRKIQVDPGQWCSPGFWRNSPIQAAAVAGSVDWGFLPDGVTYLDVLNSPQTYGGELFNLVGDALSTAHPDVNFLGERVEDSCPLSADASIKLSTPVFGKKK